MREMEQDLRDALKRVEAPDGFTGRVLARLPHERAGRPWYQRYGAVAAAVALASGLSVMQYRRHVEQERARKLVFVLHLTAEKLAAINHRLKVSEPVVRIEQQQREEL